jgi:hypothetical protein
VGGYAVCATTHVEIGVRLSTPHEMTRTRTLERGVEEWSCTQCSRRLLFRRPPAFEKTVLERGDEWAAHVGSAGGLQMGAMQAHRASQSSRSDRGRQGPGGDAREERRSPWLAAPAAEDRGWLAANGIEWESDGPF